MIVENTIQRNFHFIIPAFFVLGFSSSSLLSSSELDSFLTGAFLAGAIFYKNKFY